MKVYTIRTIADQLDVPYNTVRYIVGHLKKSKEIEPIDTIGQTELFEGKIIGMVKARAGKIEAKHAGN